MAIFSRLNLSILYSTSCSASRPVMEVSHGTFWASSIALITSIFIASSSTTSTSGNSSFLSGPESIYYSISYINYVWESFNKSSGDFDYCNSRWALGRLLLSSDGRNELSTAGSSFRSAVTGRYNTCSCLFIILSSCLLTLGLELRLEILVAGILFVFDIMFYIPLIESGNYDSDGSTISPTILLCL